MVRSVVVSLLLLGEAEKQMWPYYIDLHVYVMKSSEPLPTVRRRSNSNSTGQYDPLASGLCTTHTVTATISLTVDDTSSRPKNATVTEKYYVAKKCCAE